MAKKKKVEEKKVEKGEEKKKETKSKSSSEEKSLLVRFRIFCHGVKTEFQKIHWPSKYDLVKYYLATIIFVLFLSLFFYGITTVYEIIFKDFA